MAAMNRWTLATAKWCMATIPKPMAIVQARTKRMPALPGKVEHRADE